jgi:hypothetical protein
LQPLNHCSGDSPCCPMMETNLTLEFPFPSLIDISMTIWSIEDSTNFNLKTEESERYDTYPYPVTSPPQSLLRGYFLGGLYGQPQTRWLKWIHGHQVAPTSDIKTPST